MPLMPHLVLFDIDGTLLAGGAAKEAFRAALLETFGTEGDIGGVSFAGKTDPQIARELLVGAGFGHREVDRGLPRLWNAYLSELEERLQDRPVEVLGGVRELLEGLESSGEAVLGLVTGNIFDGARLKLGSAGLFERFEAGGYGSDHETRNRLPAVAIRRARETTGIDFPVERVVVVGDTPRDVECGRHEGTRTVAVATGRFTVGELRSTGADVVLEDFRDTAEAVGVLLVER